MNKYKISSKKKKKPAKGTNRNVKGKVVTTGEKEERWTVETCNRASKNEMFQCSGNSGKTCVLTRKKQKYLSVCESLNPVKRDRE